MSFLKIDRPDLVDLSIIGSSATLWKGSLNGDGLAGKEEHDPHSQNLREINPDAILLEYLPQGMWSTCEDRMKRLRETHILLDVFVFLALWGNKNMIPSPWKYKRSNLPICVHFEGTVLRDHNGRPCIICLSFKEPMWRFGLTLVGDPIYEHEPSAVLSKGS